MNKVARKRCFGARPPPEASDAAVSSNRLLSPGEGIPESDPAFPIIAGILGIIPASRWTFANVERNGNLGALFGSHGGSERVAKLADEYKRQRTRNPTGPRIAPTLGSLDDFASGIALIFADARADFGILTLLRTTALGPFTAGEIRMLTFALDALSDRLSALRLQPAPQQIAVQLHYPTRGPADGAFYVLDRDLQIVLSRTSEAQRRIALTGLRTRIAERLPTVIEESVRRMTAAWSGGSINKPGVAHPVSFLVVRTQPLSGPEGLFIGVRIERFQSSNSLTGASSRFHISPRELQVLALLLDGNHLDQIAQRLFITSSTVQDHIKSMLDKTASSNRSELIARVLGWESTPTAQRANRQSSASTPAIPLSPK